MQLIYVLFGYEGSAHHSQVLRDAATKPNRLRVLDGKTKLYFYCFWSPINKWPVKLLANKKYFPI